jgi:hypothetical protein
MDEIAPQAYLKALSGTVAQFVHYVVLGVLSTTTGSTTGSRVFPERLRIFNRPKAWNSVKHQFASRSLYIIMFCTVLSSTPEYLYL